MADEDLSLRARASQVITTGQDRGVAKILHLIDATSAAQIGSTKIIFYNFARLVVPTYALHFSIDLLPDINELETIAFTMILEASTQATLTLSTRQQQFIINSV